MSILVNNVISDLVLYLSIYKLIVVLICWGGSDASPLKLRYTRLLMTVSLSENSITKLQIVLLNLSLITISTLEV